MWNGPPLHGILHLNKVTKAYGGLLAVNNVSFNVNRGQILAIIGPNGAGKTTLLNLISGFVSPTSGEIWFNRTKLNGMAAPELVRLGIVRTFQYMELFADMSVLENVMMGRHTKSKAGFLDAGLRFPRAKKDEEATFNHAMQRLAQVGLANKAFFPPLGLPLGQQKLLALARALATEPALLLLDEPAAGLSAAEVERLAKLILKIRQQGITVIVVEHVMDFVLSVADRVLVLNFGEAIAEGTPEEIRNDQRVISAYLGE